MKVIKFINAIFFLFFFSKGFAQVQTELIIDSGIVSKRGVYKTFDDFRFNSPLYDSIGFTVKEEETPYGGILEREYLTTYEIVLDNPESMTRKDSVWGFCDGVSVYRAHETHKYKDGLRFYKFIKLGRYCIFNRIYLRNHKATPGIAPELVYFVLNINNGGERELTSFVASEILKRDPVLFKEYKKGRNALLLETIDRNLEHRTEYIIKYSQEHSEEIKR